MGDFSTSDGGDLDARGIGDHWTDLALFTDSVRNIIARPGTFTTLFPETSDDGLVGLLQDGLAECHLQATFVDYSSDANGLVRPALTSGQVALVVLNAGLRLLRAELINRATSSKYVAGPVSAETSYGVTILRDIMRSLEAQKVDVTTKLTTLSSGASFYMQDSYLANFWGYPPLGTSSLYDWLPPSPSWLAFA